MLKKAPVGSASSSRVLESASVQCHERSNSRRTRGNISGGVIDVAALPCCRRQYFLAGNVSWQCIRRIQHGSIFREVAGNISTKQPITMKLLAAWQYWKENGDRRHTEVQND